MPKKFILVIDDHPAIGFGITQILETTSDLDVCGVVSTREEVLHLLDKVEPHAAMVDLSLGDKQSSGLEMIALLQAHLGRSFPVLIYSMHDEMVYAERALNAGARGYLMKQEPARHMLEALRTVLEGKVYLSQKASQAILRTYVRGHEKNTGPDSLMLLTKREFEVFRLLGQGLPPREVARLLFLSAKTVEVHRARIREKLGFTTSIELGHFAVDWVHRETQ